MLPSSGSEEEAVAPPASGGANRRCSLVITAEIQCLCLSSCGLPLCASLCVRPLSLFSLLRTPVIGFKAHPKSRLISARGPQRSHSQVCGIGPGLIFRGTHNSTHYAGPCSSPLEVWWVPASSPRSPSRHPLQPFTVTRARSGEGLPSVSPSRWLLSGLRGPTGFPFTVGGVLEIAMGNCHHSTA